MKFSIFVQTKVDEWTWPSKRVPALAGYRGVMREFAKVMRSD